MGKTAVTQALNAHIIEGNHLEPLRPKEEATRVEAAVMLKNML
jgi:hypothetical protein